MAHVPRVPDGPLEESQAGGAGRRPRPSRPILDSCGEWYGWRRERVGACRPQCRPRVDRPRLTLRNADARLVTQNVDGLHELALEEAVSEGNFPGDSAARAAPIRLHGSLFRTRCTGCDNRTSDRHPVEAKSEASLPRCRKCAALLRPDVVWFGEGLDPEILRQAMERAETAEVCLVVGTSGPRYTRPASLPLLTRESGGVVVEVKPRRSTPLTAIAVSSIRGRAGQILPRLLTVESETEPETEWLTSVFPLGRLMLPSRWVTGHHSNTPRTRPSSSSR